MIHFEWTQSSSWLSSSGTFVSRIILCLFLNNVDLNQTNLQGIHRFTWTLWPQHLRILLCNMGILLFTFAVDPTLTLQPYFHRGCTIQLLGVGQMQEDSMCFIVYNYYLSKNAHVRLGLDCRIAQNFYPKDPSSHETYSYVVFPEIERYQGHCLKVVTWPCTGSCVFEIQQCKSFKKGSDYLGRKTKSSFQFTCLNYWYFSKLLVSINCYFFNFL